jgi:CheY-like chemotaxis protein
MTSGAKQRILVVDDNQPGRYATGRLLRRAGYDVMNAVAEEHPGLLLLDVRLPDIKSADVCGGSLRMTPGAKQRILIADDNEPGRYATGRLLLQAGYDVMEAVAQEHPNLVLQDVRLPDITGVEVCGRIKAARFV